MLAVVLSSVLLIPTLAIQNSDAYSSEEEYHFETRLPPIGSIYAVNVVGTAHISGKDVIKPVSADIELKVVNVKATGIPTVFLELTSGSFSVGDDVYTLNKGSTTITANKVNIKVTSEDGTKILAVFATLADPLPISTSADPVGLIPAVHDKPGSVQVGVEKWVLNFSGNISRTA